MQPRHDQAWGTHHWFTPGQLSTIWRRDLAIYRTYRATTVIKGMVDMSSAAMQLILNAGRQLGILLCTSAMATAAPLAADDGQRASQFALEAAYIYNFIQFMEWPDGKKGAPADILVSGDDLVRSAMQKVAAEANRTGHMRLRIDPCVSLSCLGRPQVVFIGSDQEPHLQQWLNRTKGLPVLTVSDIPGFADRGGMIELVRHQDRLTFRINRKAIESSNLYVSAQLLQLGDVINGEHP